ncbi:MAG: hypothetical protein ABH863_01585 [Candidatus Micrarchaeota archaeon]
MVKKIGGRKAEGKLGIGKKAATGRVRLQPFNYILVSAILFTAVMLMLISQERTDRYSAIILLDKTIPLEIPIGTKFTFGFEILNREGDFGLYRYEVFLDGSGMAENRLALEDGERRRIFEALQTNERGPHKVVVALQKPDGAKLEVYFGINAQ